MTLVADFLLHCSSESRARAIVETVAEGIMRWWEEHVAIDPLYNGAYGTVPLPSPPLQMRCFSSIDSLGTLSERPVLPTPGAQTKKSA